MGKLADEAQDLTPRSPSRAKLLDRYMDRMDADDRKAVLALLADDEFSSAQVAEFLTEHGFPISSTSIKERRRGPTR